VGNHAPVTSLSQCNHPRSNIPPPSHPISFLSYTLCYTLHLSFTYSETSQLVSHIPYHNLENRAWMVHMKMEYYTHIPLINVGKAYLATHDGTIVDRYSYGYIHTSLLPPSGIFRCPCRWPNDDDAPSPCIPFHVAEPDDLAKESTLTQSSFPPSIIHPLSFPHLTTIIQSNRYPHATYHLNNKQYADLRKSTHSPMLCRQWLTNPGQDVSQPDPWAYERH